MKKLIIILLGIIIYSGLLAQSKSTSGDLEPLTTQVSTKASTTSVDDVTESVSGVIGKLIEITDGGDSVQLTIGASVVKWGTSAASISDATPPSLLSVEVGNLAADTMVLTFDEDLNGDTVCATTAFTIATSLGDLSAVVDNVLIDGDTVKLTLDSAIISGENVNMTYTRPTVSRLQDATGNVVVSTPNESVSLNIEAGTTIQDLWRFENNLTNEVSGGATLVHSDAGTVYYNNVTDVPEGTYSLNLDTPYHVMSNAAISFASEWTIAGWLFDGDAETARFWSVDNYIRVWMDYINERIEFTTLQGGSQTGQSIDVGDVNWDHLFIGLVYKETGGTSYLSVYLNGVNVSEDSIVGDCSSMNDIFRYGYIYEGGEGYTDLDALHMYSSALTPAQMVELYANTSVSVGGDPGDHPGAGDYTVLFSHDFDDLGLLSRGSYDPATDPGFNSTGLAGDRRKELLAIVSDGTDTVLAHYYDQGHHGSDPMYDGPTYETNPSAATGAGTYFVSSIKADNTGYNSVYFSYNVKTMPGFYVGVLGNTITEMKMMGLGSTNASTTGGSVRLRYDRYQTQTAYFSWYNKLYPSHATWSPIVGDNTNSVDVSGAWQNVTIRVDNNTPGNSDGLIEMFKDGVFVAGQYGVQLTDGYESFYIIYISTATGGGLTAYQNNQESNMYIYHDDYVVWETDVLGRGEASGVGRVLDMPTECNLGK